MTSEGGPGSARVLPLWVESVARRLESLADETRPNHPRVAGLLDDEARRLRAEAHLDDTPPTS